MVSPVARVASSSGNSRYLGPLELLCMDASTTEIIGDNGEEEYPPTVRYVEDMKTEENLLAATGLDLVTKKPTYAHFAAKNNGDRCFFGQARSHDDLLRTIEKNEHVDPSVYIGGQVGVQYNGDNGRFEVISAYVHTSAPIVFSNGTSPHSYLRSVFEQINPEFLADTISISSNTVKNAQYDKVTGMISLPPKK